MSRIICLMAFWIVVSLTAGCGPDTIFVRPGLDTPGQHVHNGHKLLKRGKLDDACREFNRAMELDPKFIKAYIGLGVALGRKGDFEAGVAAMDQADRLAASQQDRDAVQDGYRRLKKLRRHKDAPPKTP